MKIKSFRVAALVLAALAMLFVGTATASASIVVRIGPPAPPVAVERPWAPPYRGAVWIRPHYEWVGGQWVWVRGYYTYPPRRGGVWVDGYWRHGHWYPGHWR